MGDNKGGAALAETLKRELNLLLRVGIDGTGGFVEENNVWLL